MKRVILEGLQEKIEKLQELEENFKKPLEEEITSLLDEVNQENVPSSKMDELKEIIEELHSQLASEPSEITEMRSEIENLQGFQDRYNNMLGKIREDETLKGVLRNFSIKKDTASFLKIQKFLFINEIIGREIFIMEHLDLIYIKDNPVFKRNVAEINNLLTFVNISANINMVEINNNLNSSLKASIKEEMNCSLSYDNEDEYTTKQARVKAAQELVKKSKGDKNKALRVLKESYKAEIINSYGLKF